MGRHKYGTPNGINGILGQRLRAVRNQRGLTLAQLGRASGLSHAFLSQIENSRAYPSISTLYEVADALDVEAGALLLAEVPTELPSALKAGRFMAAMDGSEWSPA